MKKINDLYPLFDKTIVYDIKNNSKDVKPGDIFVCTRGVNVDRHDYIDEAINNGASFLVVGKIGQYQIPFIKVDNPNKELMVLSQKFYDYPDEKLKLIGITGTDGKTTTAMIIRDLIGINYCGYIGTNGAKGKKLDQKLNNTTPECHIIYKILDAFVKEDLRYVAMETSSEAFFRKRLEPFHFDIAILTNITEDHLNVHKTLSNYIDSKKQLFKQLKKDGIAILNCDDKFFDEFQKIHKHVLSYGKNKKADLLIKEYHEHSNNTEILFEYNHIEYQITSPLLGEFNVYNLMGAILALIALDIPIAEILPKIPKINIPSGRMEILPFGSPYKIILDYAHTTNGLKSVLNYLKKMDHQRIITVVGSAGGREKEKRSTMGKTVLDNSDLVIFTTDDPRMEDPLDIIKQMIADNKGCYQIILDRGKAIEYALDIAKKDDIVLIAGKGRDNYMAVKDQYIPYCDYDVIKEYFNNHQ